MYKGACVCVCVCVCVTDVCCVGEGESSEEYGGGSVDEGSLSGGALAGGSLQ